MTEQRIFSVDGSDIPKPLEAPECQESEKREDSCPETELREQPDRETPPAPDTQEVVGAPSVIMPSRLALIAELVPGQGFVTVRRKDGSEEVWPAERLKLMAEDCIRTLATMERVERDGGVIPEASKKQVMELSRKTFEAYRRASYRRETIGQHDAGGKAVDRMLTGFEWQKGMRPERGEYTEEHIAEEHNIRYYKARFPELTEAEISAVLRADDVPWKLRVKMLSHMNGKRMVETLDLTQAEVWKMITTGKMPDRVLNQMSGRK